MAITLEHPLRFDLTQTILDAGFFEEMYQLAHGEPARLPWGLGEPHPSLVSWLNAEAPCLVRPGCRVAVVGCGLGDDAVELMHRGFDVTAFDCSRSAIDSARRRFPQHAGIFVEADVRTAPSRWRHRFDLVVEINTLPWINPEDRECIAEGIVDLLHPKGVLLVICPGASEIESADEPALTPDELLSYVRCGGLEPTRPIDDFEDGDPPRRWLRGAFRQPSRD